MGGEQAVGIGADRIEGDIAEVEKAGEPGDVDEVTLPAKPAAILSGKTKWEEAVPNLKQAFARIEADLAKIGVTPAGRPLAVFTRTSTSPPAIA